MRLLSRVNGRLTLGDARVVVVRTGTPLVVEVVDSERLTPAEVVQRDRLLYGEPDDDGAEEVVRRLAFR